MGGADVMWGDGRQLVLGGGEDRRGWLELVTYCSFFSSPVLTWHRSWPMPRDGYITCV